MSENQLAKLVGLLESKNRALRSCAISALAQTSSFANPELLNALRNSLQSSAWHARVAAADAIGAVLLAAASDYEYRSSHSTSPVKCDDWTQLCGLDINYLITNYKPLLSCDEDSLVSETSSLKSISKKEQRKLIDTHLDLNVASGVSSKTFILDEEIDESTSKNVSHPSVVENCKEDIKQEVEGTSQQLITAQPKISENEAALDRFIGKLFVDLMDHAWHKRHGAALALSKIILFCPKSQFVRQVEPIAVRLIQMLSLDRFNDFVTGSSAVAPVREAAAQGLSLLIARCSDLELGIQSVIFRHLKTLLNIKSDLQWQCRQTSLLVLKYYFSICKHSDEFVGLFDAAVAAISDPVDEVASKAIIALSALFSNSKLDKETKAPLISVVMKHVWGMVQDGGQHSQLKEGVDSLLIDLLNIVEIWLKIDEKSTLEGSHFRLIIELLDVRFITRSIQVMKCICSAFDKSPKLESNDLFLLLKTLYRCVLFASHSESVESNDLLKFVFETLVKVLLHVDEKVLASMTQLQKCVGYWMSCLIYDHKSLEINVFAHCIDGVTSSRDSPMETLCGEDIRFLTEEEINEAMVSRKVLAARFLSPLLDVMYRSDVTLGDQPLNVSIQLLFTPYLRSNSLYQRLGASLVANSFARMFRKKSLSSNLSQPFHYPILLIKEAESCVLSPLKTFDEVTIAVNLLINECNEFREYCVKKGVPTEELTAVDHNNMEEVTLIAFESCKKRLLKPDDISTLNTRYLYILELIKTLKLSIRTNIKINALLSSTLFYYNFLPPKLTPMIRPLIEATDCEKNLHVVEEIFFDSFCILLSTTTERSPCPHAKIFKPLWNGLNACDHYCPKPAFWNKPEHSTKILLKDSFIQHPMGIKSRNCQIIIEKFCEHFGAELLIRCPEIKNFVLLDTDSDLETFIQNMEMLRVVHNRIGFAHQSLSIFSPLYENVSDSSPLVERLFNYLRDLNPAVRFRTARFLADLALVNLLAMLNLFYKRLQQLMDDFNCPAGHCGAIELLARLSESEHAILGAVSLFAPLALRAINDPLESVRQMAAYTFGKFVAILSLENPSKHRLSGLTERVERLYENSFEFSDVLSCPAKLPLVDVSSIIGLSEDVKLRAYQLEGITWMRFLSKFGLNGILADDMGLGKTLQVLCLLAIEEGLQSEETKLPTLILCPRTLVDHWCHERRAYFPGRKPFLKLAKDIDHVTGKLLNGLKDYVLVASYEELRTMRIEELYRELRWNYVILDEGHCIRNSNSQLYKTVCELKTCHKLILSGTPVQNSPADLWALFTFLMPGYLSSKSEFNALYMKHIMACRNPKATEQQTNEGEQALKRLHQRVLPFILRRLKSEVLSELPEKVIQDYYCRLSEAQQALYSFVVDNCGSIMKKTKNDDEDEEESNADGALFSPLHTLILLRKLVDHPSLIANEVVEALRKREKAHIFDCSQFQSRDYELSGKMVALKQLLEQCQIGRPMTPDALEDNDLLDANSTSFMGLLAKASSVPQRALVFCQWKTSVDLIAHYIDSGAFGADISYLRLDGSVPPNERFSVVNRFNHDLSIDLLLLTTHIGGVGLTLTGANVVIFVDHDWNPVKDLQAIDRAHRLGQTRTVNVYRLITQGSIEEKVMRFQKFKTDTADVLVGADNRSMASMAASDLRDLFSLSENTSGSLDVGGNGTIDGDSREPVERKRPRKMHNTLLDGGLGAGDNCGAERKWLLERLWDCSQYEEQYSIEAFMESAACANE